jgi:hypothetical protein
MGNKRKKNEPAIEESIEEPEIYFVNIAKIAEDLKKSYRVVPEIAPKIVIDDFKEMIINILHILGFNKYITVEFSPITYDKPLHTFIMASKPLEEEWGKDKVDEFIKEFYNNAMKEFVNSMNIPKTKVLEGEVEAVHLTALNLPGIYGFNAVIELDFMPPPNKINEFQAIWILVKK